MIYLWTMVIFHSYVGLPEGSIYVCSGYPIEYTERLYCLIQLAFAQ